MNPDLFDLSTSRTSDFLKYGGYTGIFDDLGIKDNELEIALDFMDKALRKTNLESEEKANNILKNKIKNLFELFLITLSLAYEDKLYIEDKLLFINDIENEFKESLNSKEISNIKSIIDKENLNDILFKETNEEIAEILEVKVGALYKLVKSKNIDFKRPNSITSELLNSLSIY